MADRYDTQNDFDALVGLILIGGFLAALFLTFFAIADLVGLSATTLAEVLGNPLNGRPRVLAGILLVGTWVLYLVGSFLLLELSDRLTDRDDRLASVLDVARSNYRDYQRARSELGDVGVSLPELDADDADLDRIDDQISKGRYQLAADGLEEFQTAIDEGFTALSEAASTAESEFDATYDTVLDRLASETDRTTDEWRSGLFDDIDPDLARDSNPKKDPDATVDRIEKYRTAVAETYLVAAEKLRSDLSEETTPDSAQTALRNAHEAFDDDALDRARDRAETAFEVLLDAYVEASRDRASERVDSLIDEAAADREDGDEAYDDEEYERAREAYSRARENYRTALGIASEHDIDVDHSVRESLDSVNEWHGYATLATAAGRIAGAESAIESDPSAAIDDLDGVATFLKSASLPDEGTFDDRKAELYDRIDRERFRARIERERNRMADAERAHDDGELSAAKSTYESCREAISDLRDRIKASTVSLDEYDLDRLESVCADNAEAIDRELAGVVASADLRAVDPEREPATDSAPADETNDSATPTTEREAVAAAGTPDPDESEATPSRTVSESIRGALPEHDVVEWIGSGGNADVHKIRLAESGTIAALKIPRWEGTLSASRYEEFTNEAEVWAKLDTHDNIVDVIDWGTDPYPWLLLEYVDGSLADRLSPDDPDGGPFEPSEGVDIVSGIADALEYAHGNGVVHLDVKPENILLDGDAPKVADWGLARLVLEFTRTQMGLTPAYSAPEQLRSEYGDIDRRTDIYQLGALTYRLLTGRLPFEADRAIDLQRDILETTPEPPSAVVDSLPAALDAPIMRALSKRPTDRHDAVVVFRNEIRDAI